MKSMEFSSLVWGIPMLLLFAMLLGFTLNHNRKTTNINMSFAIVSFLLALCVIVERYLSSEQDYGYYLDWFVVDNFYYRIGYELNNTASYFLVIITAINVILHVINRACIKSGKNSTYAYLNLIFGLIAGIVIADNVLTYYILSFCMSVALFLYLASNNENGRVLILRKYVKGFITGHLLFLCALMLIFYHQPNHAVEFTVIDSSISMQPDLLNMKDEWIIGLLLILSSVFTSTIIAPFERQYSTLSDKHILLVYVLMSVRIILPAYMLIRFESLIRIDERIESVVLVLGILLLIYTSIKVIREHTTTQKLLTMSNAMLGMLYIIFGLQAKQMLTAFVLIFMLVQVFAFICIHIINRKITFNILKLVISILLFFPFVICISTSKHYNLDDSLLTTMLSLTSWLGMIIYSFIIISCLRSFKLKQVRESFKSIKYSNIICALILLIALCMVIANTILWWTEFMINERSEFVVTINSQIWINVITICTLVSLGLVLVLIKERLMFGKQLKNRLQRADMSSNATSVTKTFTIRVMSQFELWWNFIWEIGMPYMFKKGESYVSIKQPRFVVKLISIWAIAIILSILLVIIRG